MIFLRWDSHPFPSLAHPLPKENSQTLVWVSGGFARDNVEIIRARSSGGSLDEISKTGQRFAPLSFKRHPVETYNVLLSAPPRASSKGCVTADDYAELSL